jgi:hypothetical protein
MHEAAELRIVELRAAQTKAESPFQEIEVRGLIRANVTESRINEDIYALAKEMYGTTTYWHKRIVRAGRNTLLPYAENPPDLPSPTMTSCFLIWDRSSRIGRQTSEERLFLAATRQSTSSGSMQNKHSRRERDIFKLARMLWRVNSTTTSFNSQRNQAGSLADRSRVISLGSSRMRESRTTKCPCTFILPITSRCEAGRMTDWTGTGSLRFTL